VRVIQTQFASVAAFKTNLFPGQSLDLRIALTHTRLHVKQRYTSFWLPAIKRSLAPSPSIRFEQRKTSDRIGQIETGCFDMRPADCQCLLVAGLACPQNPDSEECLLRQKVMCVFLGLQLKNSGIDHQALVQQQAASSIDHLRNLPASQ
jgi:hypothetical protein